MNELDRITVFNDFLTDDVQVEILKILRMPGWNLGFAPVIEGEGSPPAKLWHMNGLERHPLFSEFIFKQICKLFQTEFKVARIYANGQLACQKGLIHRDDGDLTFLYYPLQKWRKEWGGNLMFFDDEEEVRNCVSYVPNRAISFPASILHGAEAPSKDYDGMRVSIGWKLLIPR